MVSYLPNKWYCIISQDLKQKHFFFFIFSIKIERCPQKISHAESFLTILDSSFYHLTPLFVFLTPCLLATLGAKTFRLKPNGHKSTYQVLCLDSPMWSIAILQDLIFRIQIPSLWTKKLQFNGQITSRSRVVAIYDA